VVDATDPGGDRPNSFPYAPAAMKKAVLRSAIMNGVFFGLFMAVVFAIADKSKNVTLIVVGGVMSGLFFFLGRIYT
jgi:hypothetical protein